MPGRVEFDVTFGRTSRPRDDSVPMRLLLLGDFHGKPPSERPPLASRPTLRVDVDSLTDVMRRLSPCVHVAAGNVHFNDIDDFHPGHLVGQLDVFKALREKRNHPPTEEDDSLARLLGTPAAAAPAPPPPSGGLDALIHNIVAPHIVKDTPTHAKLYVEAVDAALTDQMRAVLHDPAFQAMESAWRGVHWLTTSLELDENLQLHLLDVTRQELLSDLVAAGGKIGGTGLHRALVDRWRNVPGGQSWSALVSLFQFGTSDTDVGMLAALGLIASQAGGPLLGGGDLSLGEASEQNAPGWFALRGSEAAPWIALAAPRVLLRLPYGKRTDPVEAFAFEEVVDEPPHEDFLWGNASLALALLIGRSFSARSWQMELGDEREIDDLPAYTFDHDGESRLQACAEHYFTESQLRKLLDAGLVPIASRRDRNGVVAIRFQSIAHPAAPIVW